MKLLKFQNEFKIVIELLSDAILKKYLLKFYCESKSRNTGERIIQLYMIIPGGNNFELVGIPITELTKMITEGQPGHYTISQLEERLKSNQLEVLPEAFGNPGVQRKIVVVTKTPPV